MAARVIDRLTGRASGVMFQETPVSDDQRQIEEKPLERCTIKMV